MKTVDDAFFDPAGDMVVTISRGRFHGYAIDHTAGELTVEKLWDYKLSHVFWIAFGADVIIASNTTDHHVAISKKTGELVWERPRPKRDGISGRGIVVRHGEEESYVFTGYKSVFQISTATGQDVCAPWPIELWTKELHDLGESRVGVVVGAYVSANRDHCSLATIDLAAQTFDLLCDLPTGVPNPLPGAQGKHCLVNRLVHDGSVEDQPVAESASPTARSIEVLDASSLELVASRVLGPVHTYLYPAVWSPGNKWIGVGTTYGYLILSRDLEQAVAVPYGRARGAPSFHPDEEHVLLPRRSKTSIERIDQLADTYGPPEDLDV